MLLPSGIDNLMEDKITKEYLDTYYGRAQNLSTWLAARLMNRRWGRNPIPIEKNSTSLFHRHGRAVCQDFGNPAHDLGGVVAGADDGVRAHLQRVFAHQLEGVIARLFTEFRVKRDVAAKERLDARAERSKDGP
jgi:hypothetical protein